MRKARPMAQTTSTVTTVTETAAAAALAALNEAWAYFTPEAPIESDAPVYEAFPEAA